MNLKKFKEKVKRLLKEMWDSYQEYYFIYWPLLNDEYSQYFYYSPYFYQERFSENSALKKKAGYSSS